MNAIGITAKEEALADETTPPHILLLLEELKIGFTTDPRRKCVTKHPGFKRAWRRIQELEHDNVVAELNVHRC